MAKSEAWKTPTELAYLAGFFDGEGYVGISTDYPKWAKGNSYLRLRVNITQKDKKILEMIKDIYGGTLHKGKDGVHKWYVDGQKAISFLKDVLPFLILKKEQTKLAIEFVSLNVGKNKSVEQRTRQQEIAVKIKELKREQYA